MNRTSLLLAFILVQSTLASAATVLVVEDEGAFKQAPAPVRQLILKSLGKDVDICKPTPKPDDRCSLVGAPVDLTGNKSTSYVVIPNDFSLWGASAAPVWVVLASGSGYTTVLNFPTYQVKILDSKTNGLRDIQTSRGNAAGEEHELWKFNGKSYMQAKKW